MFVSIFAFRRAAEPRSREIKGETVQARFGFVKDLIDSHQFLFSQRIRSYPGFELREPIVIRFAERRESLMEISDQSVGYRFVFEYLHIFLFLWSISIIDKVSDASEYKNVFLVSMFDTI